MYLEDLFMEAWFHPDEFDELKEEWIPILITRIVTKFALKLNNADIEKAEKYLKNGDNEKFRKLCSDKIPNYEKYFISVLQEFEDEYLENFKDE